MAIAILCARLAQGGDTAFSILADAPDGPVFKTNSEVRLSIALKNTTNHNISIPVTMGPAEFVYQIEAKDAKGNAAPYTKYGRGVMVDKTVGARTSAIYVPLKPGETRQVAEVIVSKLFDLSKPGEYTIRVHRYDDQNKVDIDSNELKLTVTK